MGLFDELETLGELLASNLEEQGVSATANDGLTTLANKILDIGVEKSYQRVEYLQSTGSQYINTEYILKSTDKVEVTFSSQGSINYEAVYGARKGNYNYNAYVMFSRFNNTDKIVYNRTGQEKQGSTGLTLNTIYKVVCESQTCNVYDQNDTLLETITTTGTVNDCINPCGLFTLNTDNGTGFTKDTFSNMKIYHFKVTSNDGTVQRDMYPVREGTVGGMYDTVTKKFYATYGTFYYGDDVDGEIIFLDDMSEDKTSLYNTEFHYALTTNETSFSYVPAWGGLLFYGSGGDGFAGRVIPETRGKDNIKIRITLKFAGTRSAYAQFYIGMTDILSQTSGNIDFFRIRGDEQVDYIHNDSGSESWKQTGVMDFANTIVTIEFKREGTSMTGTVYDENDNILATTTQTLNNYTDPYYFFGVNTNNSTVHVISNIRACELYIS